MSEEAHRIFLGQQMDEVVANGGAEALLAIMSDDSVEKIVEYIISLEEYEEDDATS